jgi:hypothetical protein
MAPAPDMGRLTRIAFAYIAAWAVSALFDTSQVYRVDLAFGLDAPQVLPTLANQLALNLVWAVFTPVMVAFGERLSFQSHKLRDALLLAAGVPLLSVVRTLLGSVWLTILKGRAVEVPALERAVATQFHSNIIVILTVIALTRLVCAWNESRQRETHAAELMVTLTRARFDELHTRLQTDFLMHALQTIGNRIHRNDPSSDALIVGLSDLLRQVLDLARQRRTTLEGELDLLDRYLSFHELLSGRRIEGRYEFDEPLLSAEVPLMMLQPLFNEAIAGARSPFLHITVRGRLERGSLKLEVEDDAGASPRLELRGVRERVTQYLAGAVFESDTRAPLHTTRIDLPFPSGAVAP